MAWLGAVYQPTTLFSLRPSWTTSSGGKSLLLPSPFALKMAVLDAAIRTGGRGKAERAWPWVRDMAIAVQLPPRVVVTNLFIRILRLKEIKTKASEKEMAIARAKDEQNWPFTRTIGYREYVYHSDPIAFAFEVSETHGTQLGEWLEQVNYLGKRGGFVQMLAAPRALVDIRGYTILTQSADQFPIAGMIQQLDDCDPGMKFEEANIYESKKPKRIVRHIVLPYRLTRSSRSYSLYEYTGL